MKAVSRPLPLPRLSGPPAVWAAFAEQGRWKNWVLVAQLLLIGFMTAVCFNLATREPDVVVVGEDGSGTYVQAHVVNAALLDFLRQQRGKAADVTLLAYTQRFVRLTAGMSSASLDESWSEALGMMTAGLAQRVQQQAAADKLLEAYRLAPLRATVAFTAVDLLERRGDKSQVRARIHRKKERLPSGPVIEDDLQVDLILVDVPRSRAHPDGLEVLEWRSGPIEVATPSPQPPLPQPNGVAP